MRQSSSSPTVRPGFVLTLFVVLLVPFLAWSILPMLSGGGPTKVMQIVNNLRQIELMKERWASSHSVTGSVQISEQDLAPLVPGYSSNGLVRPVIGERYILHRLGVGPEAQLTRRCGKFPAGTFIRLRPDTNRLFRIYLPNGRTSGNRAVPLGSAIGHLDRAVPECKRSATLRA